MIDVTLAEGPPQYRGVLTVFPLVSKRELKLPHQLLVDALAAESLNVSEIGEGRVSTIEVENLGADPVLLLDGEQLIGAKQSRAVSRSIVVAAKSKTEVPVSCVERGRWHFVSRKFKSGKHHSPARVRRKVKEFEYRMMERGVAATASNLKAAQGRMWDEIDALSDDMLEHSPTSSLDDVTESVSDDLESWSEAFPYIERQVGAVAFLGSEPLAIDLVGSTKLFEAVHPRLMRSYSMDALSIRHPEQYLDGPRLKAEQANDFLQSITEAPRQGAPTVGLGNYYVIGGSVAGGVLEQVIDGWARLIHLTAYPR